ncbi:MAG: glycosyltransferase [Hyphomicrobiaceae bacterium]
MTSRTVLIEGHNLTLDTGTGIATYARNLGSTVRDLGYQTEVVVGSRRPVNAKDPLLAEVSFYDARGGKVPPALRYLWLARHAVFGSPFGLRPVSLRLSGAVMQPAGGRLSGFDRVHVVHELADAARLHFYRHHKRAELRLESPPHLFHATHATPMHVRGVPNIYTIHDLVPLRIPFATLDDKKYFLRLVRLLAREADHIVTVSERSKADLVELIGIPESRITNTYQSVHIPPELLAAAESDLANELDHFFQLEPGGYFLFVGAIEPKKNLTRLIDAYASSGSARPLVIVGAPGWQYEHDLERIADEQFLTYKFQDGVISPSRKVRRLQYLPFARLISLMRGARAVLFPSLYEGFGLPVLEAMLAGAPVLTSSTSSLPEVAGDAALLVDPNEVDAIAAGIRKLDSDDDLCKELSRQGREQAKKFSPERYKERIDALYKRIMG